MIWHDLIGGGIAAALMGGLGWVIKQWVNGIHDDVDDLKDLVNERGANIEGQVLAAQSQIILVDDKVTSTQIKVAEICGHIGLPVEPPLIGSLPRPRGQQRPNRA